MIKRKSKRSRTATVVTCDGPFSHALIDGKSVDREALAASVDMTYKELALTLGCTPRLLKERPHDPQLLRAVCTLAQMMNQLTELMGERRFALHWLWYENEISGGKTGRGFLFSGGLTRLSAFVAQATKEHRAKTTAAKRT